jgi:hypothetical protein
MKNILLLLVILLNLATFSQNDNSNSSLETKVLHNKIRLNNTKVHMPNENGRYDNFQLKPTMGFAGMNYNIPLNSWLYTDAGFHFAITGDQDGLFTLGVNKQAYKSLYFDANIHYSGGSVYRVLVHDGGVVYPNIGLQYKMDTCSFDVLFGKVDFFTGVIKNDNISFFVEIPSTLRYAAYKYSQKKIIIDDNSKDNFWKKPAVKSAQQVTFDFLYPIGDSRTDSFQGNKPINNTLSLLGFEYQRYLTKNTYIYAHLDAMYQGLIAGNMNLFFGVGKNFIETKYVNLFAKFGIGAAVGRIFPEGDLAMRPCAGVLVRSIIGINYHFKNDFSAHISGGQMISSFGNVNSINFSLGPTYAV